MKTNKISVKATLHYHLTAEEIENPDYLICQFFDLRRLPGHLNALDLWKDSVLTLRPYFPDGCASSLLLMHDLTQNLVEAAWLLRKEHKTYRMPEAEGTDREKLLKKQRRKLETKSCYLGDEELLNPYLVFSSIFKTCDFKTYRSELYSWLSEGLACYEPGLVSSQQVMEMYENLQRLYQAAWLVYQRE